MLDDLTAAGRFFKLVRADFSPFDVIFPASAEGVLDAVIFSRCAILSSSESLSMMPFGFARFGVAPLSPVPVRLARCEIAYLACSSCQSAQIFGEWRQLVYPYFA